MKKYFIAVAALGLLAACSGKQSQNVPVEVEEESVTVAEAIPVAEVVPVLPALKKKAAKPVNMRDSLKVEAKKGAVVQKKFKGTVPAAKSATGSDVVYDLTLYFQQDGADGVYEMDAAFMEDGQSQAMNSTGKTKMWKGTPDDASALVYEFWPSDGSAVFYFVGEGNSLKMVNKELKQDAAALNYTLQLVQ